MAQRHHSRVLELRERFLSKRATQTLLFGLLFAGGAVSLPLPAWAQFTAYTDRSAFTSVAPSMIVETFEKGGAVNENFNGPVDSTTTAVGILGTPIFKPGDLKPDVRFSTTEPGFDLRLRSINGSKILSLPSTSSKLKVDFLADDITAVSFDAFQFNTAGSLSVDIFGTAGLLGTASVTGGPTTPGFLGLLSTQAIKRLVINDSSILPGIDNLAFGPRIDPISFLTDRAAFQNSSTNLVTETFERGGAVNENFMGPVDSTTTAVGILGTTIFKPSDLKPGVRFSTTQSDYDLRLRSINGSKILSTPNASAELLVDFLADDITAVSFDAFQFNSAGNISVDVFGADGILLQSESFPANSTSGSFVGIFSNGAPIKRLVINDSSIVPGIDNLTFGSHTAGLAAAPEPGSLALLAPAVWLAGLMIRRRQTRN